MTKDQVLGHAKDAATATPPIGVVMADLAGIPVEKWLVIATLFYTVIVILHRIWHWTTPPKGK